MWISSAGQPASLPYDPVALGVGLQKSHKTTGYCVEFTKLMFRRLFSYCAMVILLSFLTLLSSLSIGMRKQLASPQHSIHGANREVNAPAVLSASDL